MFCIICIGKALIRAIIWHLRFLNHSTRFLMLFQTPTWQPIPRVQNAIPLLVLGYSAKADAGLGAILNPSCPKWFFLFCLVSRSYMTSGSCYWCKNIPYCLFYLFLLFSNPDMAGHNVQYTLPGMLFKQSLSFVPFLSIPCYAVILHNCSCLAHNKATVAQCCRECPLLCSYELQCSLGQRLPVHSVHPVHSLMLLTMEQVLILLNAASTGWLRFTVQQKIAQQHSYILCLVAKLTGNSPHMVSRSLIARSGNLLFCPWTGGLKFVWLCPTDW
jgi:hypothetical protein